MSLILEALKKSERQRRLGESPSLGSPVVAVRRRRSLLPVFIVLIAMGLLALWWLGRDHNEPAPAKQAAQIATAPVTATSEAPVAATKISDATSFNDAPLSANRAKADSRVARTTQAGPADTDRQRKLKDGELVAANPAAGRAATIKESEPVAAADPAALAAAMADAGAPVARIDKASDSQQRDRKLGTKTSNPMPVPATASALGAAGPDGLKLMWELPLATRQKLPEIKVSMHVFAKDPAQRFVIINGERHAQGDDIDGMVLVEIRADGIVFEHEGVRFLYPRGGR